MSQRSSFRALRVSAAGAVLALLPAAGASAAGRFGPLSTRDQAALERARNGAARRLKAPACQQVLSDFTDPEGRRLSAVLETWQLTPSDYLRQAITFLDGSKLQNCEKATVPLVTSRGQLAVFVCPAGGAAPGSRFVRILIENPAFAEIMVIHEMLHTLGLGENPPTTFEITDRVMERCGDHALAQRSPSARLLPAGSAVTVAEPPPSAVLRDRLAANVRISDPSRAAAIRKAVLGAFDSLGKRKCQEIFAYFRDASGRTLQEKLDALGQTGQSYLGLVLFYEGSDLPGCRSSVAQEISAVTAPSSRVVFICKSNFSRGRRPKPFYPEAIIIHETLHSLGLGENPPTSDEITWRVLSRCG